MTIHLPGFNPEYATPAEWARLYRSLALQVVPAFMPGEGKGSWKRPLLKDWRQYQDVLVTDEVFDPWYGPQGLYRQRLNMGVICGRCSGGLFVIDLDTHKYDAAGKWWMTLINLHNNNMELETVEQRTGGGGFQKLFFAPAGWTPPTCKTPIGVDIRGQGGFAMLAPSLHESGQTYDWLDGFSPDEIDIQIAPQWLTEAVDALVREHGGSPPSGPRVRTTDPLSAFDGFGHQTDGREQKMTELVWGAMVDWRRDWARPTLPNDAQIREKAAEKYLVYEGLVNSRLIDPAASKTDLLEREGRGTTLFWQKWCYAFRQWDGKVAAEAIKPGKSAGTTDFTDFTDEYAKASNNPPGSSGAINPYPFLDVNGIMDKPDPVWAVEDLINEKALGFLFGPPGSLKTFIALDLALSMAAKVATWWDKAINRHGAVVYLCREGTASFKYRIRAWEEHRGVKVRDVPFYLIEHPTNFMRPEDVMRVLETVKAISATAGQPIGAVFVDTVSRVLPGAKENQQEDMSLFVGACEYIQQQFDCIVVGLHHVNKNGSIRGSTVIPGAGDFLIETRREPGSMMGSIVLQKIKDGEDGVELPFKVTKIDLGGIVPRSSLMVDPEGEKMAAGRAARAAGASGGGLPDILVCREILSALALAWFNRAPWGSADNGARPAVRLIMARWTLKREPVRKLLDGWMANGIIEHAVLDAKNRVSGYRKLLDI